MAGLAGARSAARVRGLRFGVILADYCSDRTRTVHVGRPSDGARQFTMPCSKRNGGDCSSTTGVTCAQVDGAARGVLRKRKLARYFTHSTGHGLGLEIHEAPRLAAGQARSWSRDGDYD